MRTNKCGHLPLVPPYLHLPLSPFCLADHPHHDRYHNATEIIVSSLVSSHGYSSSLVAPSPRTSLVNGAATYQCQLVELESTCKQKTPRDMPELRFPPDTRRVRLRFINVGAHPINWVPVDEHEPYADNTQKLPVQVYRISVVFGLPPHLRPPHRRLILPHAACFGADFPDPDPQTRIVIRIADEGHRLARTLPRSREWNDPTTGNWTDLDERLLEPIVVQHAPPQADQISFFNSSRIGPLTTTDEAGLSDGISFLEWTLNNINCENFAGLNQALAATSVFYGSDLASLITPKLIQALDGAAMSSASTAAIFSLLARLPKEDFVGQALEKLAIASGLMASKTQARKAIEAGTIQLNGTRIPPKSHQRTISEADLLDRRLVVIKAGKTAHKAVLLE
ncbi:hypothetical protein NBRC10512v2_004524 [Rhodotorula toruloides]